ncbi:MAG: thiosulfate oxidation carrier protein SoxY [Gammaproteobacteria bacterium]
MHDSIFRSLPERASGCSRREWLRQAAAACGLLLPGIVFADDKAMAAIETLVGGREAPAGELKLTTPAIAENGNTVPIAVEAGGRFTAERYVKSIHVFAPENPVPEVVTFEFTPKSGFARASTRIRLAKTQDVIAIAELSDGSVWRTANEVKVTIGGCGG